MPYQDWGYRPPAQDNWFKKNKASNMKFAAGATDAIGDYMDTMLASRSRITEATWDKFNSERQARQMRENAKMARASAGREAQEIQYQGRVTQSDAIAAMAAQGGVTDPTILANIKKRVDYNALQAIFQGERTAGGMEAQARATEGAGKLNYMMAKEQRKINKYAATSNLFSKVAFSAVGAYG